MGTACETSFHAERRPERRRSPRRVPDRNEPLAQVRLRAGRELEVVSVSNTGVLVEGTARLLPGTHVDVHIVGSDGRVLIRSRVVRAWVCGIQADNVRYRGALAFERAVNTAPAGYVIPDVLSETAAASGSAYPDGLDDGGQTQ